MRSAQQAGTGRVASGAASQLQRPWNLPCAASTAPTWVLRRSAGGERDGRFWMGVDGGGGVRENEEMVEGREKQENVR